MTIMGRKAWYRFVFEDGYQTIRMGYQPLEMRMEQLQHGLCVNKVFVAWDNDVGGNDDVSAND